MDSDIQTVRQEIPGIVESARQVALSINNEPSYQRAGEFLIKIKTALRKIEDVFGPIVEKAYQAHKEAVKQKKGMEEPIKEAEQQIKCAMADYFRESERKRKEEEFRLQEELRKKEEEERLHQAEILEKAGENGAAVAVLEAPILTPSIVLPKTKAEGVGVREAWEAEIVDLRALVNAVASGKQPLSLLLPDMKVINGMARSLKTNMVIPGVRVVSKSVVSARAW